MAVLAHKLVGVSGFEEILSSPYEVKKNLQLIVCNVSSSDDYLFLEIESTVGDVPLFWNFPVLSYDTYVVPILISLGIDEKIKAKSLSGGLAVSVHEKI